MTNNQAAWTGAFVGLIGPVIVLVLLYSYGVFEIMFGSMNLTQLFWPSSRFMIIGWNSSARGILTTLFSVSLNCLLYMMIAVALRVCVHTAIKRARG